MSVAIPFFLPLTMQVKLCLMKFALELALQLTVYWQNQWYNIGYFICYAINYVNGSAIDYANGYAPDMTLAMLLGMPSGMTLAIGNAIGYGAVLIAVAFFRELLGSGSLLGIQVIPDSWYIANGGFYANNGFMLFPPMALIVVGLIIWAQRARNTKLIEEN